MGESSSSAQPTEVRPKGPSYRNVVLDGFQILSGEKKGALVSHRKLTDFVKANLGAGKILRPAILKKTLTSLEKEDVIVRKKGSYLFSQVKMANSKVKPAKSRSDEPKAAEVKATKSKSKPSETKATRMKATESKPKETKATKTTKATKSKSTATSKATKSKVADSKAKSTKVLAARKSIVKKAVKMATAVKRASGAKKTR